MLRIKQNIVFAATGGGTRNQQNCGPLLFQPLVAEPTAHNLVFGVPAPQKASRERFYGELIGDCDFNNGVSFGYAAQTAVDQHFE